MTWRSSMADALRDFEQVAALAGEPIESGVLLSEFLPAPHQPPSRLPFGTMAIYGFCYDNDWLKIGKAGPRSGPRFTSHHYHSSAPSTLAKSLSGDPRMRELEGFDPLLSGDWIRQHTHRVNILLPSDRNRALLSLLEAFLHVRLKPRYEG